MAAALQLQLHHPLGDVEQVDAAPVGGEVRRDLVERVLDAVLKALRMNSVEKKEVGDQVVVREVVDQGHSRRTGVPHEADDALEAVPVKLEQSLDGINSALAGALVLESAHRADQTLNVLDPLLQLPLL